MRIFSYTVYPTHGEMKVYLIQAKDWKDAVEKLDKQFPVESGHHIFVEQVVFLDEDILLIASI